MTQPNYHEELRDWQTQMDEQLRSPDGWLTLVGLYWMNPGENLIGCDPSCQVVLPAGTTPAVVGTLSVSEDRKVVFNPDPKAGAKIAGKPAKEQELEPDTNRNQTIVEVGEVNFHIILRGERTGVRVKQANSPNRIQFSGRVWWPVDENFRVTAEVIYYDPQKMVGIPDILGDISETAMDCMLKFELDGKTFTLDAFGLPSGQYYILFHDQSCGNGSYPAGRFLVTEYPDEDSVVIDFNKSHNPPCAFTSFATCPLPPEQNFLAHPIQAGERYKKLDHTHH